MRIAEFERALLVRFPREQAEAWDHIGLSCGRPDDEVRSIACALDASLPSVQAAADAGANVLITHHPIHITAPDAVVDAGAGHPASSRALFTAIERGVSVISLHTNLDRSREARELLPGLLGLTALSSLVAPDVPGIPGLGAIAEVPTWTLSDLARQAQAAFGGASRSSRFSAAPWGTWATSSPPPERTPSSPGRPATMSARTSCCAASASCSSAMTVRRSRS